MMTTCLPAALAVAMTCRLTWRPPVRLPAARSSLTARRHPPINWTLSSRVMTAVKDCRKTGIQNSQLTINCCGYCILCALSVTHTHTHSLFVPLERLFSRRIWVNWYHNVSIVDFVRAKDDGGGDDNWSYKTCKSPVKSSPPTNQHPAFHRLDALPVSQPTVSEHW